MGSFEQLAGMMPGQLGKQMANAELDPKMMAHTEAIILSMTPYERENPAVLGASRKSASPPAADSRLWTSIACSSSLR